MLRQRVATAIIGLPLIIALLVWGPPWLLFCFFLLCVAISVHEVLNILLPKTDFIFGKNQGGEGRTSLSQPLHIITVALGMGILGLAQLTTDPRMLVPAFMALLLASVLIGAFSTVDNRLAFGRIASLLISVSYGALPWVALYHLAQNQKYLYLLLAIVWAGDTGAYFGGRLFGKRKLAPTMSPKKTIEGAIAGLLSSILGGCLLNCYYDAGLASWTSVIGVSIAAGILGQMGDLAESTLKRFGDVKDSGWILPGHGGLLDRVDGLMFSAPLIWLWIS